MSIRHAATTLASLLLAATVCAGCSTTSSVGTPPSSTVAVPRGWTLNGHQVPASVVDTRPGPAHCGWDSATFLTLGWPLGTHAQFAAQARQYIRDPNGVISTNNLRSSLGLNAKLPPDARPTGYQDRNAKLYLAPSDEGNAVYIVNGRSIERWPRSDPMTLCS